MSTVSSAELTILSLVRQLNSKKELFKFEVKEFGKDAEQDLPKRVHAIILKDGKPLFFSKSQGTHGSTLPQLRGSCTKKLLKLIIISGLLNQAGLKEDDQY